jgi:protein-L-isoaspartate(D-aspartate) O-methyltransferase
MECWQNSMTSEEEFLDLRQKMVTEQLRERGIQDPRVLAAMNTVPRHWFTPNEYRDRAYEDRPLPIGAEQTISQPYIVALMTQELRLSGHERVLEIGTGSGYQTAILCELANYVYTLERFPQLADEAASVLAKVGYNNVDIHAGDGSQGLPDMAPFDAIIVTAAAPSVPGTLCWQMENGGRLIIPVGDRTRQVLQRVIRQDNRWQVDNIVPVKFVPLLGRFGFKQTTEDPNDDAPAECP